MLSVLPSAQLAYYTSEYPGLQCLPSLPPIPEVSDRRHSASKKPSTDLLLANCGVLFRGYMSAQAVLVSVIITTCSPAPFRFHHLCGIKQPAAGSSVDCPGAATVRLWVSEYNCCLHAQSSGLFPSSPCPPRIGKENTQLYTFFRQRRSEAHQMSSSGHESDLSSNTNMPFCDQK